MTAKQKPTTAPGEPNPDVIVDVDKPDAVVPEQPTETTAGPVSIDEGPPEPEDQTEDMSVYVEKPGKAVTMGDVAALNGVGLAPDASRVKEVGTEGLFISAGMASDLENQGWTLDPLTGNKVVKGK